VCKGYKGAWHSPCPEELDQSALKLALSRSDMLLRELVDDRPGSSRARHVSSGGLV
jgi:hypothetical protein